MGKVQDIAAARCADVSKKVETKEKEAQLKVDGGAGDGDGDVARWVREGLSLGKENSW